MKGGGGEVKYEFGQGARTATRNPQGAPRGSEELEQPLGATVLQRTVLLMMMISTMMEMVVAVVNLLLLLLAPCSLSLHLLNAGLFLMHKWVTASLRPSSGPARRRSGRPLPSAGSLPLPGPSVSTAAAVLIMPPSCPSSLSS